MQEKRNTKNRKRRQTKDKVLQARIPEQLDEELRERAEELGLSVSTIVRNTLLNTFDLVEGVVSDSSQIARALSGWAASSTGSEDEAAVIGWQEAILNRNGVCEQCNDILPKGQRAAIGVPAGPRAILLCMECLPARSSLTDESAAKLKAKADKSKVDKRKTSASRKKPVRIKKTRK